MPIVIVMTDHSVPTPVMRLQRVVGPALTGIGARDNNILAGESERPDLRRVRVIDPWLNGRDGLRPRGLFLDRKSIRDATNQRVTFDPQNIRARRHLQGNIEVTFYPDQIDYIIRAMLHVALAQPGQ